jgi:hypothetical protein
MMDSLQILSTFDMESGQSENLRDAMSDVANTVEYLISKSTHK